MPSEESGIPSETPGRGRGGRRSGRGRGGRGGRSGRGGRGARGRGGQQQQPQKAKQQTIDAAKTMFPPDLNWLAEETMTFIKWDNSKEKQPMLRSRICLETPPVFSLPKQFPVFLPEQHGPLYVAHKPGAVEMLMEARAENLEGISLEDIDIVATPSFLPVYAMWGGHPNALKDRYLLQSSSTASGSGKSTLFAHIRPWSNRTDVSGPGFAAERLFCPREGSDDWYFSVTKFTIGSHRMLIVAEIDGFFDMNRPIEMTVQSKPKAPTMKQVLQLALNGSSHFVRFKLSKSDDDGPDVLTGATVFSTQSSVEKHKDGWIEAGQRIQYTLDSVLKNELVRSAIDAPVHMTFGKDKSPILKPAKQSSTLFPGTGAETA